MGQQTEEEMGPLRALKGHVIKLQLAAHRRKSVGERVATGACLAEPVIIQMPLGMAGGQAASQRALATTFPEAVSGGDRGLPDPSKRLQQEGPPQAF